MAACEADGALAPLFPRQGAERVWVQPAYYARGYPEALPNIWLRVGVARRLVRASRVLAPHELGLVVWDGWRSRELQRVLSDQYEAELRKASGLTGDALDRRLRDFVAPGDAHRPPPAHLTGGAVDLSLCDLRGDPLDMGGDFDELTERSHPQYYERPSAGPLETKYRDRRRLLLEAMASEGFWRLPTEWWHFEWGTTGWAAASGGRPEFGEVAPPPSARVGT